MILIHHRHSGGNYPHVNHHHAANQSVKLHYALRYKRLQFEPVNLASPMQVKKYNPRTKCPVLDYDGSN